MNNEDKRVIRTKKLLKDSLKELMLKHDDYTDISVSELCEKAEINRRTFYLHYESVDDVLLEIQESFAKEFAEKTKQYNHLKDYEAVIKVFFDLHESNPIYEKMVLSPSQDYLREMMRNRTIIKLDENDNLKDMRNLDIATQNIIEQFYHMSVVTIYREWVRQKKVLLKEYVVKLTATLIENGLNKVLKNS